MAEVVFLSAKLYLYKNRDGSTVCKSKGIKKSNHSNIHFDAFKRMLNNPLETLQCQNVTFGTAQAKIVTSRMLRRITGVYVKRCFIDRRWNETMSHELQAILGNSVAAAVGGTNAMVPRQQQKRVRLENDDEDEDEEDETPPPPPPKKPRKPAAKTGKLR